MILRWSDPGMLLDPDCVVCCMLRVLPGSLCIAKMSYPTLRMAPSRCRRLHTKGLATWSTVKEASELLRSGEIEPLAVVERCLERQKEVVGLNAFVTPGSEVAGVTSKLKGAGLPLSGIPVGVKDNFCTKGLRTTASSRMLEGFTPPYSATVVERLEAAGGVVVGKTNMDEFGMGSATLFSHFGETISPWSSPTGGVRLVAGGSSGGSSAAVASGSCLAALGSDTGGSVRQPAAYCGLVGLKPSYGRLSRHGLIAYASSLDCPGVLARTVTDAAMMLDAMAGHDDRDSTCALGEEGRPKQGWAADVATHLTGAAGNGNGKGRGLKGLRVGVPREFRVAEMEQAIVDAWEEGARRLKDAGAEIVEVSIPSVPLALPAYCVIACAEAASNLARYDGLRYGFRAPSGPSATSGETKDVDQAALHAFYTTNRTLGFGAEVQRRILTGSFVLSAAAYAAYYERARAARTQLVQDFDRVLQSVDLLLTPTTPTGPFPVSQPAEPAALLLNDIMTVPASLAGLPALALPVGVTPSAHDSSLPVPLSLQLIGRRMDETTLLRVGASLESMIGFDALIPKYVREGKWPKV